MQILKTWLASRKRRKAITTIVLHATGGDSATGAIDWLRKIGLSYHYVIARDGTVTKCVPTSREAFHAGVSVGPGGNDVNAYSIGISLANRNDGHQEYTQLQYWAVDDLIEELKPAIPTIRYVTTHYAISPGRKTDPVGFDTTRVRNGLAVWMGPGKVV